MKVVKELLLAIFWVFFILIIGYFLLDFIINRNIPFASNVASWVENHAQAGS
jgi:hypothetical protein